MENIHIPNPEKLKEKISKFTKDNFHFVADFDSTLTKTFVNGERIHSSYSYVRKEGYMSDEFIKRSMALTDYYRPIEFDPDIPQKEKDEKMVEWWSKHYDMLIEYKMHFKRVDNQKSFIPLIFYIRIQILYKSKGG